MLAGGQVLATRQVNCAGETVAELVAFEDQKTLAPGLYEVRGTYEDAGKPREFYQTGFWVRDDHAVALRSPLWREGRFPDPRRRALFPLRHQLFHH